jgi:hypothetical protein
MGKYADKLAGKKIIVVGGSSGSTSPPKHLLNPTIPY